MQYKPKKEYYGEEKKEDSYYQAPKKSYYKEEKHDEYQAPKKSYYKEEKHDDYEVSTHHTCHVE